MKKKFVRFINVIMALLFLFVISFLLMNAQGRYFNNTEKTELIQQRVGYDIRLQCDLKGLLDDAKLETIKVHWFFKHCTEDSDRKNNCNQFYDDNWTELPCKETFCKPDLLLRNLTEKYSGLYKCAVYPHYLDSKQALDIQLVRTYLLEVKNITTVPEFLNTYPNNQTAIVGSQVVFQCRVYSTVYPTVKWFKRIATHATNADYTTVNSSNFNTHIVNYKGRTYELLSTAQEKIISDHIYLSNLVINDVRLKDEGYYACVAISYRGQSIREAYLQVKYSDQEYWADYDTEDLQQYTDPREFLLLFLMPLGLAVLPIMVWLCFRVLTRCKHNDNRFKEQQYLSVKTPNKQCVLQT
ncbi:fibroblast growth factor receptor-like 1 [Teleopsis dalmanni]|uniref:fibroblast growth factor receptor-like 1 n=1 Tax=Teleopsis dalmanni TaxID=139649 RepID=UPI000D32BC02|nr:fibroblast growth factor receptor-like 1 [Teleopsis dalmanni]XP_037955807.1 fibroblast growth factor receptor-like 1 [Teleopsis dalmanni]